MHLDLDLMGNVITQKAYGPDGILAQTLTRSFDALNRLARELSGSDPTGTSFRYDGNGNLTTLIDQLGRPTFRKYDTLNRVVRDRLYPPAPNTNPYTIDYAYDPQDNLISVTDLKHLVTRYTVDPFGQRTRITSPDTGVSTASFDAAGNLTYSKDARGIATDFEFDAAGRLIKHGRNSYGYGSPGTEASGLLTKMIDDSGETTFGYDGFGRLTRKAQTVTGIAQRQFDLKYAYGANGSSTGHVSSITYPSGNRIQFTYGSDGRVSSLALVRPDNAIAVPLLSDISYRPFGPVASWTWGNGIATGRRYQRVFDIDGKIISYPLGETAENGTVRTLIYDAAGRITATTHSGNAKAASLDQRYYYDGLDRLTGFDSSGTSQRYSYDRNGNRTSATFGSITYANSVSADSNRLETTSGPQPAKNNLYDAAGNLLSDGTFEYRYGADGRLESAKARRMITRYRYNGLGQRVAKSQSLGSLTYYVYDKQGRLIGEYDGMGSAIQETVYLDDLPVAVITWAEPGSNAYAGIYYVYSDHLLTPRVISRATDSKIVWRWDSADPFGLSQPEEFRGADRFTYNLRFPGQVFDNETSNHYNYFRDYDPQSGRYVQADPVGLYGGMNAYTYASGNPITGIDPFGLADLNLFSSKHATQYNGANAWNAPGFYSVAGHGNSQIMQDPNGTRVYPDELAKLIRRDPNWKGQPIILGGCHTGFGNDPFAQRLANDLNVPVTAPLEYVWFWAKGLLGTSFSDRTAPEPGQTGRWKTFSPRR